MSRLARGLCAAGFLAAFMGAAHAQPVTLNVVDVAGNLALTQEALESFAAKNPTLVSRITFTKAPSPELPGKIRAMQAAGRTDIDLVLTGTDALAAGIALSLWEPLLPAHAAKFPNLMDNYLPAARKMQDLSSGQGVMVTYTPAGPLLEYNPDKVKTPPKTPAELLSWCKANPNKLIYARPANSGPGRTFLMGLPYMLGDSNPKDPIAGWDKTWAYLKELNSCIEYYPTGTGAVFKELGEGSRDMTVTMTGWDINPRALGVVPKQFKVAAFNNFTWVDDAHYMVMPKGLPANRQAVVLQLMAFLLQPAQQALTYDAGYFYPGPAVKDVPLTAAPQKSQDVIKEFGRAEYADWITKNPHAQPLEDKALVAAFKKWDQEIGSGKAK
ncbi:extracellular solute-binding protein [Polaromonas sp. YR568]|uniref:extracellular solute-binding protein n=1 Tax=Polaromonas sp. YR568 TaxID=1855301 RepID=UPI000B853797|nr:extracellular solute-binding protein [Polaromonas sp. YR568]